MCDLQAWTNTNGFSNCYVGTRREYCHHQESTNRNCDNCGEYYLSNVITEQVLNRSEVAINNGAEVEIIRYAA